MLAGPAGSAARPSSVSAAMENGAFATWACRACEEYLRPEAISPWTWHLVLLYQLRQAGYPFDANDLTLEEWLLLGLVQRLLTGEARTA